jgi:UDP-2,3-diacylglucosamine hydrolase
LSDSHPNEIALIAGKGVYPRLLAEAAKKQGVSRLFAVAFRRETDRVIEKVADEVAWIYLGQFGHMLDALKASGVRHAVMAGQITPTHLFNIRPDAKLFELLRKLPVRNAETIFGAVGDELRQIGIELIPASSFMEEHMPAAGLLGRRTPTESEARDIELGFQVAKTTSGLDIGQTVVIKEGTILAVEAFEGTDETILRAGKLGGKGAVVVKVAKQGHDMRFDIPVVGLHTFKVLRKIEASTLAVEAGRAILLEREAAIAEANRQNLCFTAVQS